MEINDERIKKKLLKIEEIQDISRDKYYSWLRNIITLAVGFFGLIVSLKSDKTQNFLQHTFFTIALSCLVLGIISGIVVLYSEIHLMKKVRKKHFESIIKMLDDEKIEKIQQIRRNKIFDFIEYFCFICFILSLFSLVLYSYYTY